jgi:hypothetical protein
MDKSSDEPTRQLNKNINHDELSPTLRYQYEECKAEEEKSNSNKDFRNPSQNEPLISDETNLRNDISTINRDNEGEIIREFVPTNIDLNSQISENQPNNQLPREPENEFYQHNLQHLVHNLNNLRDILQTIVSQNEIAQHLNPDGAQQFTNNIQNFLNPQVQALNQNNFFDFPGLNANNINPNLNFEYRIFNKIKEYLRNQSKNGAFYLNLFSILTILIVISGASLIPSLEAKSPAHLIYWLGNHRNSRLLLIVISIIIIK